MKTLASRTLRTLADTAELAAEVAAWLRPGGVLLLVGDLGAGKTTFTQALAKVLGVARPVTSPTFTLANAYPLPHGGALVHMDLYRLASPQGLYDLGLEEALEDGARVVIEWPERAWEVLGAEVPHRLTLRLTLDDAGDRHATVTEE